LRQFELGNPAKVVIVSGPPDFDLPQHAAPYREIFMVLSGSVTATLSGGQSFAMKPGALILFEDTTGQGHGGKVGPCGYVSLDLQFKPS
jgi:quercetin dioxygenase-like cupin family protein